MNKSFVLEMEHLSPYGALLLEHEVGSFTGDSLGKWFRALAQL